jgi:prepilin-type N-terminal cleavage/methylation domain-containing protein
MSAVRAIVTRMRHRAGRAARDESGFSLLEMTIAVLVLGIVLSTATGFISTVLMRGTETSEQTQLQAETRQVMDQLVREIRQASTGTPSVPAIETMQAGTIQFLAPDSSSPYAMRRIAYTVTNGQLQRAAVTSSDTDGYPWVIGALPAYSSVLGSVQNTNVFTYQDDTGAVTAVPGSVSTVVIRLDIDPFPGSGSGAQTYTTSVHLRSSQ